MLDSHLILNFAEAECAANLMAASEAELKSMYNRIQIGEFDSCKFMLFVQQNTAMFVQMPYYITSLISEMAYRGLEL